MGVDIVKLHVRSIRIIDFNANYRMDLDNYQIIRVENTKQKIIALIRWKKAMNEYKEPRSKKCLNCYCYEYKNVYGDKKGKCTKGKGEYCNRLGETIYEK